jgi:hypothetical protein
MATALGVAACKTNCWALASGRGETYLICGFVGFDTLDFGSHLDRLASVFCITIVDEVDRFEMVGPYRKGARTSRLAIVANSYQLEWNLVYEW